jgi:hypothetical protein
MSYLLDLIRTLTDSEMKGFRHLDVIGKEESVRDLYAKLAHDPAFDESTIGQTLSISAVHLLKINSILLDKTITALYGHDHSKVFTELLSKGLSSLMLHELKIREKGIVKVAKGKALVSFYRAAFDILCSMYHPNYDSVLTHQFGEKYLKALGAKATMAEQSFVNMTALYGDIIAAAYSGQAEIFKPKAEKLLSIWERKSTESHDPVVRFYTNFAKATFYKHMTEDARNFVNSHEAGLAAFKNSKGTIEKKYEAVLLCELGLGHIFIESYAKAQEYYTEAFERFSDTIGKSIYHSGHYFHVAHLNSNFELANVIFERYLKPKIQDSTNRSVLFDIYLLAVWSHIQQKQFDKAHFYLTLLKQYRKNDITMIGHAMVRQVESAYFYLSGDSQTAAVTISKNLRFVKKISQQSSSFQYYLIYLDTLDKLIKMEQHTLRHPDKLKAQILSLPGGIYLNYNRPLQERDEILSQADR